MKIIFLIILAGIFLTVSGCISQQNNATNQQSPTFQSPVIPSSGTTFPRYWIRINPISDFKTDSTFNITGSTLLNISGTTNSPPDTSIGLTIVEWNQNRKLIEKVIKIKGNNSESNPFFFEYDMKGNPPGRYTVTLQTTPNPHHEFVDLTFSITTETPYLKWIQMDPLGKVQPGGILPVSGTTDLPAGSEIMLQAKIDGHSCTMATPDQFGARSLCGGSCRDTGSQEIIHVVEGAGGINIWNSTVDTSDWCLREGYVVGAYAVNWTNVTSGGQYFRF